MSREHLSLYPVQIAHCIEKEIRVLGVPDEN